MIKRLFMFPLFVLLLAAACAPAGNGQPDATDLDTADGPVVTVYYSPT